MNFSDIISRLTDDTSTSLKLFSPELIVIATIVALLLIRLLGIDRKVPGSVVAIIGTALALARAAGQFYAMREGINTDPIPMFTGLLLFDPFTVYFRIFLLLFLLFVEW